MNGGSSFSESQGSRFAASGQSLLEICTKRSAHFKFMEMFVVKTLLFVGVVFLVVIALAVLKKRASVKADDAPWPFYAKKPLTQPEQVLYHRLVAAMPECIVLAQVQLSRVLGVQKGFNFHQWNNRINRMSLDFLVCLKDSTIVAAIELDDKTHEKASRVEADAKKGRALSAAGITLVRWNVKTMPDEVTIRKALANDPRPSIQTSEPSGPTSVIAQH